MAFEVGSDIESMCNSCGDVWHVIVAKVGEKVTKVQCKQCGKQHRLKPTGAAPEANLKPTRRTIVSGGKKKKVAGKVSATINPEAIFDPNKPSRPYKMSERFALGEQIQHKKFGNGVVSAVEDEKIHVTFGQSAKILRHAHKAS